MYHIIAKAGVRSECNCSLPLGQHSWVLRTPLLCTLSRHPGSLGLKDSLGRLAHSLPASKQTSFSLSPDKRGGSFLNGPRDESSPANGNGIYLLFKVSLDRTNAPCLKALAPSNSASVGLIEADAEPFSEEQLSVNTGVDPMGSTVGFWQPVNLRGGAGTPQFPLLLA